MEEDQVQRLVETAAGSASETAWQRLWGVIEPGLWDMVDQPRFASHLAHTEESRRRIVHAIRTQLAADRYHSLQIYVEARRVNPRLSFVRWLRTFAKRVGMSYPSYDEPTAPMRRPSARRLLV